MGQSEKWTFNGSDAQKWIKNLLIFIAPAALLYLITVQAALNDGLQWSDFALTPVVQGALISWILGAAIDFFKKLSASPQ